MAGFVHQGFLQRYPYEGIDLSRHRIASDECVYYLDYKEQSALSDASGKCIRTIHVSELDGRVGTLEDWKTLIVRLCYVHSIVLFTTKRVFKLRTAARHALGQGGGVARASRPWVIVLLQQSAFFKLRTTARHARRQPLRRCRATSPCRGGFSCRENVSAVVLRPCTAARHALG